MRTFSNYLLFSVLIPRVVSFLSTVTSGPPTKSPLQSHQLPDSYIVILKDNLSAPTKNGHLSLVRTLHSTRENLKLELRKRGQEEPQVFAGIQHTYTISGDPIGYSGNFDAGLIEEIQKSPEVDFIENDFSHHFLRSEQPEPITQKGAPWNLARISHRDAHVLPQIYIYSDTCGEGVDAYVIDTGIYTSHLDFESRAFSSANFQPDDGDGNINGHGTHCAGVLAGKIFGVAKRARVFSVNVAGPGIGFQFNVVFGGGTSASAPHVAGLMAYFLSLQLASTSEFSVPAITPKDMKDYLINIASKDKLKDTPEGTRNVSGKPLTWFPHISTDEIKALVWNYAGIQDKDC